MKNLNSHAIVYSSTPESLAALPFIPELRLANSLNPQDSDYFNLAQTKILQRYFKFIEHDTAELRLAILPLLTEKWAKNIDTIESTLLSFAKEFSPEQYQECVKTVKHYINGRDFIAPERFTTSTYFGGEIRWASESPKLKELNEKLDRLVAESQKNAPKQKASWLEWTSWTLNQATSTVFSLIDYTKKHPMLVGSMVLLGQSVLARAATPAGDFSDKLPSDSDKMAISQSSPIQEQITTIFTDPDQLFCFVDKHYSDNIEALQSPAIQEQMAPFPTNFEQLSNFLDKFSSNYYKLEFLKLPEIQKQVALLFTTPEQLSNFLDKFSSNHYKLEFLKLSEIQKQVALFFTAPEQLSNFLDKFDDYDKLEVLKLPEIQKQIVPLLTNLEQLYDFLDKFDDYNKLKILGLYEFQKQVALLFTTPEQLSGFLDKFDDDYSKREVLKLSGIQRQVAPLFTTPEQLSNFLDKFDDYYYKREVLKLSEIQKQIASLFTDPEQLSGFLDKFSSYDCKQELLEPLEIQTQPACRVTYYTLNPRENLYAFFSGDQIKAEVVTTHFHDADTKVNSQDEAESKSKQI